MRKEFYYEFNFKMIQNFKHFLAEENRFTDIYFVPLGNKMLFISPCHENIYMTLSDEIQNGIDELNHVFSIDKMEFLKFIKKGTKNSEFRFQIIIENNNVIGNCTILNNGKVIDNVNNPAKIKTDLIRPDNFNFNTIFNYITLREFDFKELDLNKNSLSIDLKYYQSINICLRAFENYIIDFAFAKDDKSKATSVIINANDGINVYTCQILIAYRVYEKLEYKNDILSKIKTKALWKG